MWFNDAIAGLTGQQLVNDSKTPSGTVHVGSLRGVILHDVINRVLREQGIASSFCYALDDMDPLDGLPANASEAMKARLGEPLCQIEAPENSPHPNLAEHNAADFLATFTPLGVEADMYRMSEYYRDGKLNEAIEAILTNAAQVREIYYSISKSKRPDTWYPYQVVCEKCGKIGSTEVYNFDGKQVQYRCQPNYTSWANGCGHSGSVSPFDGNGKLVWKLEWVAKWYARNITFEGAGKDHCTKGGSRDIANACMRRIFGKEPPRGLPYEFFLVDGKKMSSSQGIGSSAASMAALFPPEVLRFLMIHTPPKRTVSFSTGQAYFVKLFNAYDQVCAATHKHEDNTTKQLARMIGVRQTPVVQPVGFGLLLALLQLPHLNLRQEIVSRYTLDAAQLADLDKRIATAQTWLTEYAKPEDRIEIQQQRPQAMESLSASQLQLLLLVAQALSDHATQYDDESMQQLLFDCARMVPCSPRDAFVAVYIAFLGTDNGPKAGSLLAYLDRDFVLQRLASSVVDLPTLWRETGVPPSELIQECHHHKPQHMGAEVVECQEWAVVEVRLSLSNGQHMLRRSVPMPPCEAKKLLQHIKHPV